MFLYTKPRACENLLLKRQIYISYISRYIYSTIYTMQQSMQSMQSMQQFILH